MARLALETGSPIIPTAILGTREIQPPGQSIPANGKTTVIYGKPIVVQRSESDKITHDELRALTDRVVSQIRELSGQEYVDEYAQKVKEQLKAKQLDPQA